MEKDQIEEMAVELGVYACKETPCRNCAVDYDCIWRNQATRLYNKGYRKASEVAEEIFAEIEKCCEVALMNGHIETPILCIGHGTFAELKKKYTEEGK